MKKILFIISCLFLLIGCSSSVKYDYQVLNNVGIEKINKQDITLIDNYDKLTEILDSERFSTASNEWKEKANFDFAYFEDNNLILIFLSADHSGTTYSLKSVEVISDVLNIEIKTKNANLGTDVMVDWAIILQIPKTLEFSSMIYKVES